MPPQRLRAAVVQRTRARDVQLDRQCELQQLFETNHAMSLRDREALREEALAAEEAYQVLRQQSAELAQEEQLAASRVSESDAELARLREQHQEELVRRWSEAQGELRGPHS